MQPLKITIKIPVKPYDDSDDAIRVLQRALVYVETLECRNKMKEEDRIAYLKCLTDTFRNILKTRGHISLQTKSSQVHSQTASSLIQCKKLSPPNHPGYPEVAARPELGAKSSSDSH